MSNTTGIVLFVLAILALGGGGYAVSAASDFYDRVNRLADGIAFAEGFYVSGSRPRRNNNPGDLTKTLGFPSSGFDGMYVIFQTLDIGWQALRKQVSMMLDGSSSIYNPNMTVWEMAQRYTTTDQVAWANNVAAKLGVDIHTKISEV